MNCFNIKGNEKFTLFCGVLRSASGDCTNNGVTAQHDNVILIGPGGPANDVLPKNGLPVLQVTRICTMANGTWWAAVPLEHKDGWCMAGGNFLWSSDSRFRDLFPLPIPAHDRVEG